MYEHFSTVIISTGLCVCETVPVSAYTVSYITINIFYLQCATHLNLGWKITVLDEDEVYPPTPGSALRIAASLMMAVSVAVVATLISL